MLSRNTLLDAARQHFARVAGSPNYTKDARHQALKLERQCEYELNGKQYAKQPIAA